MKIPSVQTLVNEFMAEVLELEDDDAIYELAKAYATSWPQYHGLYDMLISSVIERVR